VGSWVTPDRVVNERGEAWPIDTRLPFPWPDGERRHIGGSLITRAEPLLKAPDSSLKHHRCVDMEAAAQAALFAERGIPFHLLKWISDRPGQGLTKDLFREQLRSLRERLRQILGWLELPSEPSISVVIPVFNRAERIGPCLDSVLAQKLAPGEIIVVDDASSDATAEALASFGDRIALVRLPENRGVSAARNAGIARAKGRFVALLDSDDLWKPNHLAKLWAFLQRNPHYRAVQSEEIWIRNGVRVNRHKHHEKPAGWIWRPSLERCLVSPSAVLLERALLSRLGGFDESLPVCEDYHLWLRLSRHHPVGLESTASLIKVGGHADQLSRSQPAMDRFRVAALLEAWRSEREPLFRDALAEVARQKLTILLNGALKRAQNADADGYRRQLAALDDANELPRASHGGGRW